MVPVVAGLSFASAGAFLALSYKYRVSNTLHGFDMNQWDYLGWADPHYTTDGVKTATMMVAMFRSKDGSKRAIKLIGSKDERERFKYHTFITGYLEPWAIGERPYYTHVSYPSDRLKQLVKEDFGFDWCKSSNWWVSGDKPDIQTTTDDNVISVKFPRD